MDRGSAAPGLLNPSFVPSRAQRELRELVRYRKSLVRERAAESNRIQKVLEGANVSSARSRRVCWGCLGGRWSRRSLAE